ncbi:hypothetical protein [Cellvibrio sp. PSBB023]|uniref:hypothetical protein n=1 Tax=Cellvibrio sp. PSBB023 TaxID=1945512 RepID=UPI001AEFCCB0|nr:hypothetical protein [Cellvibrio sp. PSBB023]
MVNIVIQDYTGQAYELTGRTRSPRSSSAQAYSSDSYSIFRLVARLPVGLQQWVQILGSVQQGTSYFHGSHPGEIYQAVAQCVLRGDLRIYQLPALTTVGALPGKHGIGLRIIKGPNPHCATDLMPEVINSTDAAQQLLNELGISSEVFLGYLKGESLYNDYQKQNPSAEVLNLLATGELLAYKIPLPPKAPPAKATEFLPATAADKPVPLAPESNSSSAGSNTEKPPVKKAPPQTLDECAQGLKEARERLVSNGYQAKYSDEQQLAKVKSNEVSQERFLVSFQTNNSDPNAKLAFQRDSGLAPVWATSFDQLENADTDPQLIADILGTPYDPEKEYVLHIIDRGENGDLFGQNTLIPTWDNMQEPTQKYLGGKHDFAVLKDVMTPEYQTQYSRDMEAYHAAGLREFNERDQQDYESSLSLADQKRFSARHNVRTEIGANSEFTGNGLTQSREGSTRYGVVETLTLENNPPPISQMKNVKTIPLTLREVV